MQQRLLHLAMTSSLSHSGMGMRVFTMLNYRAVSSTVARGTEPPNASVEA